MKNIKRFYTEVATSFVGEMDEDSFSNFSTTSYVCVEYEDGTTQRLGSTTQLDFEYLKNYVDTYGTEYVDRFVRAVVSLENIIPSGTFPPTIHDLSHTIENAIEVGINATFNDKMEAILDSGVYSKYNSVKDVLDKEKVWEEVKEDWLWCSFTGELYFIPDWMETFGIKNYKMEN